MQNSAECMPTNYAPQWRPLTLNCMTFTSMSAASYARLTTDQQEQFDSLTRLRDRAAAHVRFTETHPLLTNEEIEAVRAFQAFERAENRAMSEGTTTAGGFGVPVFLDATINLTGGESANPYLALARNVPVTTNVWKGVNSAAV